MITVSSIMQTPPWKGYSESRVRAAVGDSITPRQFAALPIYAYDILQGLIMCAMDDRQRRLLICDVAERALSRVENPDPRSVKAVKVARRYARGEATSRELATAWKVAGAATKDAKADAENAARDARDATLPASVAAKAAVWAAKATTWAAAVNAEVAAAGAAAGDAAAWAAEAQRAAEDNAACNWQIARALELIEGGWEVPR